MPKDNVIQFPNRMIGNSPTRNIRPVPTQATSFQEDMPVQAINLGDVIEQMLELYRESFLESSGRNIEKEEENIFRDGILSGVGFMISMGGN